MLLVDHVLTLPRPGTVAVTLPHMRWLIRTLGKRSLAVGHWFEQLPGRTMISLFIDNNSPNVALSRTVDHGRDQVAR